MVARPISHTVLQARRNVSLDGSRATFFAETPGGVSTDEAAADGATYHEVRISAVADDPEQEQVSAAGDGEGDDGGVNDGRNENARCAEVNDPAESLCFVFVPRSRMSPPVEEDHLWLDGLCRASVARRESLGSKRAAWAEMRGLAHSSALRIVWRAACDSNTSSSQTVV